MAQNIRLNSICHGNGAENIIRKAGLSGHLKCRSARVLQTHGPGFLGPKTHEQNRDAE
jgi:hypothetical protein